VKPPTRDPSDSFLAENAEAALFGAEKAKYTRTGHRDLSGSGGWQAGSGGT
jgi:hypothetical protein